MSRTPHFFAPGGFVTGTAIIESRIAGWSSLVARRAHNPKVVGSNPAPATITASFTLVVPDQRR